MRLSYSWHNTRTWLQDVGFPVLNCFNFSLWLLLVHCWRCELPCESEKAHAWKRQFAKMEYECAANCRLEPVCLKRLNLCVCWNTGYIYSFNQISAEGKLIVLPFMPQVTDGEKTLSKYLWLGPSSQSRQCTLSCFLNLVSYFGALTHRWFQQVHAHWPLVESSMQIAHPPRRLAQKQDKRDAAAMNCYAHSHTGRMILIVILIAAVFHGGFISDGNLNSAKQIANSCFPGTGHILLVDTLTKSQY